MLVNRSRQRNRADPRQDWPSRTFTMRVLDMDGREVDHADRMSALHKKNSGKDVLRSHASRGSVEGQNAPRFFNRRLLLCGRSRRQDGSTGIMRFVVRLGGEVYSAVAAMVRIPAVSEAILLGPLSAQSGRPHRGDWALTLELIAVPWNRTWFDAVDRPVEGRASVRPFDRVGRARRARLKEPFAEGCLDLQAHRSHIV